MGGGFGFTPKLTQSKPIFIKRVAEFGLRSGSGISVVVRVIRGWGRSKRQSGGGDFFLIVGPRSNILFRGSSPAGAMIFGACRRLYADLCFERSMGDFAAQWGLPAASKPIAEPPRRLYRRPAETLQRAPQGVQIPWHRLGAKCVIAHKSTSPLNRHKPHNLGITRIYFCFIVFFFPHRIQTLCDHFFSGPICFKINSTPFQVGLAAPPGPGHEIPNGGGTRAERAAGVWTGAGRCLQIRV